MKINNETKVGIIAVVALGMLIAGFNYLKGKNVFDRSKKIYAVFGDLGAITRSNEVKINGLTVGTVYDLQETDKDVSGIKVTISLSRDVNIPSNSVAYISAPIAGLGTPVILIDKGDATTYLQDGDEISTRKDEGLFGGLSSEVAPTLSKIRNSLDSLNVVFSNINKLMWQRIRQHKRKYPIHTCQSGSQLCFFSTINGCRQWSAGPFIKKCGVYYQ